MRLFSTSALEKSKVVINITDHVIIRERKKLREKALGESHFKHTLRCLAKEFEAKQL